VDHGPPLRFVQILQENGRGRHPVAPARLPGRFRRSADSVGGSTLTVLYRVTAIFNRAIFNRIFENGFRHRLELVEFIDAVEGTEPTEMVQRRTRHRHSHSMVPGGFDVMSRATRLTPSTSLMILEDSRSRRS